MPTINISAGQHLHFSFDAKTLADAVEAALKDNKLIEHFGLGGAAGYHWHGLSVSAPVQVVDKFNGVETLRQIWTRTINAKWQAMQTLPQELSGEQNPIKDVTIKIEHGPEFSATPAAEWAHVDGKLKCQI